MLQYVTARGAGCLRMIISDIEGKDEEDVPTVQITHGKAAAFI
jgi:hypothetical protein